MGVHLTVVS